MTVPSSLRVSGPNNAAKQVSVNAWNAVIDKIGEVVSVKDYGAIGDGVTDDTSAISLALAASNRVFFPAGDYAVSDSIALSGKAGLRFYADGATLVQSGENKKTLSFTDCSDIEIRGLNLTGKGAEHNGASTSYNGVAGLFFSGCDNVRVLGGTVFNHAGGGIRWTNLTNALILGVTVEGVGAAISGNDNNGDAAVGSYSSTTDENIRIIGCDISGHCFGILMGSATRLTVTGCAIHDIPGQHGFYGAGCSKSKISDNHFWNVYGIGIKNQIDASHNADVYDFWACENIIENAQSGIVFEKTGAAETADGTTRHRFCHADRNIVRDTSTAYPISIGCGLDCTIDGNTIDGSAAYGIYCPGFSGSISGNTIHDTDRSGIYATLLGDTVVRCNRTRDITKNAGGLATEPYVRGLHFDDDAAALVVPKVFIEDNLFEAGTDVPSAYMVRVRTGVLALVRNNINYSGKPITLDDAPLSGSVLVGSKTQDWADLATAAQQSTTVTVTGARVGDQVTVSHGASLSGTRIWGEVTADNTVTVYHRNDTGANINVASATLTATVIKL